MSVIWVPLTGFRVTSSVRCSTRLICAGVAGLGGVFDDDEEEDEDGGLAAAATSERVSGLETL